MNLPTKITIARIALIPIMIAFFYIKIGDNINMIISAVIFGVAAWTDFLDGYLARSKNMVTDLGKFLDPIADKVLVIAALFMIVEAQLMPIALGAILSIIIVARELIMGALRQIAATKNVVLAADKMGKLKTVVTDFALPLLMISVIDSSKIVYYIGYVLFIIATLLTLLSGLNYVMKNKKLFSIDG